jgi:hypothetical protein
MSRGGTLISTDETTALKAKFMEPGDLLPEFETDAKKAADDYIKKWSVEGMELTLLDVATVWGCVLPLHKTAMSKGTTYEAPPGVRTAGPVAAQAMVIENFFQRDKASIDNTDRGAHTSRQSLEICVATNLAYFMNPEGRIEAVGTASPEQHQDRNRELSLARAQAARQYVLDALGHRLKADFGADRCVGLGEEPARRMGLDDPERLGLSVKTFEAKYPDQAAQWKYWRRADLYSNGSMFVSFGAPD